MSGSGYFGKKFMLFITTCKISYLSVSSGMQQE